LYALRVEPWAGRWGGLGEGGWAVGPLERVIDGRGARLQHPREVLKP